MSWPAWVLVICAVLSVILIAYGALRAALAAKRVKDHTDRIKASPLATNAASAAVYGERINADLAQIDVLLARANAAISSINASIQQLRIPEAVAAVRTAGAAIRLLFNGR